MMHGPWVGRTWPYNKLKWPPGWAVPQSVRSRVMADGEGGVGKGRGWWLVRLRIGWVLRASGASEDR